MQSVCRTALHRLGRTALDVQNRRSVHSWHEAERLISKLKVDAYTTLGVSEASPASEIKQKYYKICRQLHPDTQAAHQDCVPPLLGTAQAQWHAMAIGERQRVLRERFAATHDAYEILSDNKVRSRYDAMRRQGARPRFGHLYTGRGDPWASERPAFAGGQLSAEERRRARRLVWGVFGFLGVMLVVANYQRQHSLEDVVRRAKEEHDKSTRMLATARERALEKWREVPPGYLGEYEARRLHAVQALGQPSEGMVRGQPGKDMVSGQPGGELVQQGEFHQLWPHGAGLGLIALLDDAQLCGIRARSQVATDERLARVRPNAQRALEKDRIVRRYLQHS
ncbi:mdj1 protein precursor [Coemansia sp. RSA 2618]|nr:mdj1 protein precursor [Coemansia sp. RSA 2618]